MDTEDDDVVEEDSKVEASPVAALSKALPKGVVVDESTGFGPINSFFKTALSNKKDRLKEARNSGGAYPPEARLGDIANDGTLIISFTEDMNWSDDLLSILKESQQGRRLSSEDGEQPTPSVSVVGLSAVDMEVPILKSWSIRYLNPKEMKINLDFIKPVEVSQGDEPDVLIVLFEHFNVFRGGNGLPLEDDILLRVLIPRQFPSASEVMMVGNLSESTDTAIKTILASSLLVNVLMLSSMELMWGVINGIQLMAYMPLFFVKVPANATSFIQMLLQLSSFEILPTGLFNEFLFFFPETEPLGLNFQELGYESPFTILNLGSIFYMFLLYAALMTLHLIFVIGGRFSHRVATLSNKLGASLYWAGILRFLIEIYFDACLAASIGLNLKLPSDGFQSIKVSNVLTYGLATICAVLPIWIAVFYIWRLQ